MKKVFLIIISLYLIIGTILILTIDEKNEVIDYFTMPQNYSRLMTEDEILSFSLFISEKNTFITDKQNITSASLKGNLNEVEVDITSIDLIEENTLFQDNLYYLYSIKISFSSVELKDIDFFIEETKLILNYVNEECIELDIGNLYLSFREINQSNHLDIVNMFGLINKIEGEKYILGIIVKFDKFTSEEIIIKSISSNNNVFKISLGDLYEGEIKLASDTLIEEIIPGYYDLMTIKDQDLLLNDDLYYLIPLIYQENFEKLYRFPLTITYIYNEKEYELIIDDYLFFDEMIRLDDYDENIRKYQYNYEEPY
ncbi:MAG: hypothetical protein AB7S96_02880 [Candidatus Izemoplasmatales bacterium]